MIGCVQLWTQSGIWVILELLLRRGSIAVRVAPRDGCERSHVGGESNRCTYWLTCGYPFSKTKELVTFWPLASVELMVTVRVWPSSENSMVPVAVALPPFLFVTL